jgi:hypothetical protein
MATQIKLCHRDFSLNYWRKVCKNENGYTFVGWVSAKCFAAVTKKDNLSDNVIMATLSGGFSGGGGCSRMWLRGWKSLPRKENIVWQELVE